MERRGLPRLEHPHAAPGRAGGRRGAAGQLLHATAVHAVAEPATHRPLSGGRPPLRLGPRPSPHTLPLPRSRPAGLGNLRDVGRELGRARACGELFSAPPGPASSLFPRPPARSLRMPASGPPRPPAPRLRWFSAPLFLNFGAKGVPGGRPAADPRERRGQGGLCQRPCRGTWGASGAAG